MIIYFLNLHTEKEEINHLINASLKTATVFKRLIKGNLCQCFTDIGDDERYAKISTGYCINLQVGNVCLLLTTGVPVD